MSPDDFIISIASSPRAHLIGIGGAGMRAVAEVLVEQGWKVTGSDTSSDVIEPLGRLGVIVHQGHTADNVPDDVQLVVQSDAVANSNVERLRAVTLGAPTLRYVEMLARLSEKQCSLAVAGTHGKSTTTAMAGQILTAAQLDPTVVCGATPIGQVTGGRAGRGDHVLVEACEYRQNFLQLRPEIAVVTGVEADHFDCYESLAEVETAFAEFAQRLPVHGMLLVHAGCPTAMRASAQAACRRVMFGLEPGVDWRATALVSHRGHYQFKIWRHGQPLSEVTLQVPGRHNVLNALAAAALAYEAGAPADSIGPALSQFAGLRRRLETISLPQDVTLIDDYAHHPTEITAALAAVREMYLGQRIWCIFQPHRALRTACLLDELADSLQNADRLVVADIFRAREGSPQAGEVTAAKLAASAAWRGAEVIDEHELLEIAETLRREVAPGEVIVTMGAGDLWKIHNELAKGFQIVRAAG